MTLNKLNHPTRNLLVLKNRSKIESLFQITAAELDLEVYEVVSKTSVALFKLHNN